MFDLQSTSDALSEPPPLPRTDQAKAVSVGDIVSGYEMIEPIARGAFGTVWEAESPSGHRVAIKFLHSFLCESDEAVERLRREAEAVATISHPNVVEVYGFDRLADGRPYIIMELLEGENLYQRLRREGAMSPAAALQILEGVTAALTVTHAHGIVHRDIKASNVFIATDNEGRERIVLHDYGLAKILESEGPELTSSRAILGTPSAMAPEQIRSQAVTPQTDIYAVGALAYHLLTGDPAFFCASRTTILYMHLHSQRPRPSARADLSPEFDRVIARAMARQPEKRYPSATSFLADFFRVVNATSGELENPQRQRLARQTTVPEPDPAQMLGVYLDVSAPAEQLVDPSDELLEDIEAIADIVEPILAAAKFEIAARRGNSALFVKVVPNTSDRAERRRLLRLLAVIRAAIESRPNRVEEVVIRLAVDAIPGSVGDTSAEQFLLEVATRATGRSGASRSTLGTPRFFAELGLTTEEASEMSGTLFRVADNSEL